jgi:hypothetical protein
MGNSTEMQSCVMRVMPGHSWKLRQAIFFAGFQDGLDPAQTRTCFKIKFYEKS